MGGSALSFPTFIIQDPYKKLYYPSDDRTISTKIDAQFIEQWIQAFFNNKLRPHTKAEVTRGKNVHNHEHIVKVTGKNFKNVVMDRTKDVFIEFYSPTCSNCRQVQPLLEALGNHNIFLCTLTQLKVKHSVM